MREQIAKFIQMVVWNTILVMFFVWDLQFSNKFNGIDARTNMKGHQATSLSQQNVCVTPSKWSWDSKHNVSMVTIQSPYLSPIMSVLCGTMSGWTCLIASNMWWDGLPKITGSRPAATVAAAINAPAPKICWMKISFFVQSLQNCWNQRLESWH